MSRSVDNSQDIIDSRVIIARIEELESDRQTLVDAVSDAQETLNDANDPTSALAEDEEEMQSLQDALDSANSDLKEWDESDDASELKILKSLADEAEGCSDWIHGESLIRDSYFEDYAQQLADDIGAINKNQNWPNNCIDWERAAEELQQDYTSVNFDNVIYWIRS